MMFEDNLLRLTVTVCFQKIDYFKNVNFLIIFFFFLISYNNVVATKQIFFSPTFLKLWVNISDSIAGVVGGPQYYQREFRYREEGDLFPWPMII